MIPSVDLNSIIYLLHEMFEADDEITYRIQGIPKRWLDAYERLRELTPLACDELRKSAPFFGEP